MKKYIIYFIGAIVLAFGVSLCFQCHFGSSSIDALNKNISDIIDHPFFSIGTVMIIENLCFILAYFLILKRKDIILPLIVTFSLGFLVDFFNSIINVPIDETKFNLIIRILLFFASINLISLGVAMQVCYKLSPSAFECVTLIVNKFLKKLTYGQCKIVIELIVMLIAFVLGVVFLNGPGEVSFATLLVLVIQGPLIDMYLKILKKGLKVKD